MTIQELKDLKLKVTNVQALEAIDLAIKYKQIVPSLELMKKIKIKKVADKSYNYISNYIFSHKKYVKFHELN